MNMIRRRGGAACPERQVPPTTGSEDGGDTMRQIQRRVLATLRRLGGQDGATAIEYALMLALIAMAVFVAVQFLGQSTASGFNSMSFSP
jgi:Flp pilus assembly pilin Flp